MLSSILQMLEQKPPTKEVVAEQDKIHQNMYKKDPEGSEAIQSAYSPFDALVGGVTAPGKFIANAVADPFMDAGVNYLADSKNAGLAAILGRRGTSQLVKNYLADKTKPARWFNGSNEKFMHFDPSYRGEQSGNVKDSMEAFFATSDPAVANSYIADLRNLDKDFTWAGASQAEKYNWLNRHGKGDAHKAKLKADLDDPDSFDAKDFERQNYDKFLREQEDWGAPRDTPGHYPNPHIREMYLDIQNPKIVDQGGMHYDENIWYKTIMDAKQSGHDAVIMQNVIDGGGKPSDVAAFWKPNDQVVSPYEHIAGTQPEPSVVEKLWGKDAVEIAKRTSVLDGL